MVVHQTNASEVTKIIREMKCKKSYGEDGITNEIIKCCSPIVENFIAIAFNECIQEKTSEVFQNCKSYSSTQKRR